MSLQLVQIKNKLVQTRKAEKIVKTVELVALMKQQKALREFAEAFSYHKVVKEVFFYLNYFLQREDEIKMSGYLVNFFLNSGRNGEESDVIFWLIINSDFGLCADYNDHLNGFVGPKIKRNDYVFLIGRKGINFFSRMKCKKVGVLSRPPSSYTHLSEKIVEIFLNLLKRQEVDLMKIAYNNMFEGAKIGPNVVDVGKLEEQEDEGGRIDFIFEPDPVDIVKECFYIYIKSIINSSFIRAEISEQRIRQMTMEQAKKNVNEMKDDLVQNFNRVRHEVITQELLIIHE